MNKPLLTDQDALRKHPVRASRGHGLWLAPLICLGFALICALVTGAFTPKNVTTEVPADEAPAATSALLHLIPDGLGTPVSVTITADGEQYTLRAAGDGYALDDGTQVDAAKAKALLGCGASVVARNRVTGDAANFGLGEDEGLTAVFTYGDASTLTLRLGNAPATGEGRYAMLGSESDVFVVNGSLYDTLAADKLSLLTLPDLTGWLSAYTMTSVTITQDGQETIAIRRVTEDNPFNMVAEFTQPFRYPANSERTAALFLALEGIKPTGIASRGGDFEVDALLADIDLSFDAETHHLTLAKAGDTVLLLVDDDNTIYTMAADGADFLKNATVTYLAEQLPGLVMMNQVDSIAIRRGDEMHTMAIDRTGDADVYTIDGETASEDGFRSMYQQMIGMLIDRYQQGAADTTGEHAAFTYTLTDGTVFSLGFSGVDGTYDLVTRDGEGHFLISRAKVDAVLDALAHWKETADE